MGFIEDFIKGITGESKAERQQQERRVQAELAAARQIAPRKAAVSAKKRAVTTPPAPLGGRGGFDAARAVISEGLRKAQSIIAGISAFVPGNYDKALADATAAATKVADTFYTEKLGEFMDGINLQRTQSKESEQRLLTTLSAGTERFTGREKQKFEISRDNALQGLAAGATQVSPFTRGQLGQEEATFERGLSDFLAGQEERRGGILAGGRQFLQRSELQERLGVAGLGREKKLDIQTGISGRLQDFFGRERIRETAFERKTQEAYKRASFEQQQASLRARGLSF